MTTTKYAAVIIVINCFLFYACGGNGKENQEINLLDGAKAIEAIDESSKRIAERRERGDTVAMPFKELEIFLPEIPNYSKEGGPSGNQMSVPGMGSWSQTEQAYTSGDIRIDISVADYNGSANAFTGATALYSMGYSQEDDYKKSGSIDLGIKGVVSYETIYKQEKRAELTLIVVDRFIIQLNADGTNNIDILKKAATSMKLEKLSQY